MPFSKRILLTGASGTVGLEVLKQLIKEKPDVELIVFDLKTKKSKKLFKPYKDKITVVYGDISNIKDVESVCKGIDVVIHLAAIIPPLADLKPELAYKVNALGTRNLIAALEKHSPNAFLIYSSSISVYGDRLKTPMIKVSDPLHPSKGDEYARTKIMAEEFIKNSLLDWTIFRLTAIMGGHKISRLMFHMPLNTSLEIATPADTAKAFVKAVDQRKKLSHRIFNLGGGASCRTTYATFLQRSFQIMGLGKLNFPEKSFAEYNFHCGYYADGDDLERILHFRHDTLVTYFEKLSKDTPKIKRWGTMLFAKAVKFYLFQLSEPYKVSKLLKTDKNSLFFKK